MTQGKHIYKPKKYNIYYQNLKIEIKEYCYVLVECLDNPEKPLYYISEDLSQVGDIVLVGFWNMKIGRIISVEKIWYDDVSYHA